MVDEEMEQLISERENSKKQSTIQETQTPAIVNEDKEVVVIPATDFSKTMDKVKENVLADAAENDAHFVKTIKDNVKSAAVEYTEVEQEKARLSKQEVRYEQEKLSTKQQDNEHRALEDKWLNKQKRREYHYNGVKPIMLFVGITEPMNLILLYFLTIVLIPFFLVSKLIRGTIGTLIAGACDEDRPKAVKGFLWTLIAVVFVLVIAFCAYMFLKWQQII